MATETSRNQQEEERISQLRRSYDLLRGALLSLQTGDTAAKYLLLRNLDVLYQEAMLKSDSEGKEEKQESHS